MNFDPRVIHMQERVIGRKVKPKTVKLLEETLDKIFVTRICILWNPPSFCRSTVRPAEDRRALIRQGAPGQGNRVQQRANACRAHGAERAEGGWPHGTSSCTVLTRVQQDF